MYDIFSFKTIAERKEKDMDRAISEWFSKINRQKMVVHFDFDGTLAEWKDLLPRVRETLLSSGSSLSDIEDVIDSPEKMKEEVYKILHTSNYYYELEPYENVTGFAKLLNDEGYAPRVLSCVISEEAKEDKTFWLEDFCPTVFGGMRLHDGDIAKDDRVYVGKRRIFVPDEDRDRKFSYIPDIKKEGLIHVLIDDHSPNLFAFEKACRENGVRGCGIKMLNGVNGKGKTWQGYFLDKDMSPSEMMDIFKDIELYLKAKTYVDEYPGDREALLSVMEEEAVSPDRKKLTFFLENDRDLIREDTDLEEDEEGER